MNLPLFEINLNMQDNNYFNSGHTGYHKEFVTYVLYVAYTNESCVGEFRTISYENYLLFSRTHPLQES